jgi:hypothetical protein
MTDTAFIFFLGKIMQEFENNPFQDRVTATIDFLFDP